MKKIISIFLIVITFCIGFFIFAAEAYAVHVNGYYRSNGTYVAPYERTAPDGNPFNNYSYPGNYNPNTGQITGGNPSTYLNNYYNNSSGSTGGYFSYPSTPTCPSFSYYDSISSSCKCLSGYLVQNGSCVSANFACWQQVGIMSSYNALSNTCDCSYGYILDKSGQCTYGNTVCHQQIGIYSSYNSLIKKCECDNGYSIDSTGQCTLKISHTVPTSPAISYNQACQNKYGANTYGDANYCYCSIGYQWNSNKTACQTATTVETVLGATTYQFSRNLKLGMTGDDVQALQSILTDKGFMDWSKNTKIGTFGSTTKQGLIKYQKFMGLKQSGILDADTIYSLNHQ